VTDIKKGENGMIYGYFEEKNWFVKYDVDENKESITMGSIVKIPSVSSTKCMTADLIKLNLYVSCIDTTNSNKLIVFMYIMNASLTEISKDYIKFEISTDALNSIENLSTQIITNKKDSLSYLVVVLSGQRASKYLINPKVPSPTSIYYIARLKEGMTPEVMNPNLIMFGTITDFKQFTSASNNKQNTLGIYKDTACFDGNGLINNNDFTKCDPKKALEDEPL